MAGPRLAAGAATRRDLRVFAHETPDHPAVVCGEARLSYAELEALANRLAAVLRSLGLERGDHAAFLLGNRPEALAIAWGAYRCGVYLTPIATSLAPREIAYLIDDCDAKVVIADAALRDRAAGAAQAVAQTMKWLSWGGSIPGHEAIEPLLARASPSPHENEPPGATALTRMLCLPHSTASDIVIAWTAVLAMTDGSTYAEPVQTQVTSMLTTEPGKPCAIQRRPHASVACSAPSMTVERTASKPRGLISTDGEMKFAAALLTNPVSGPPAQMRSTIASICAASRTSQIS